MTVVFLGGGRITSAILAGLRLADVADRFIVHDRNPRKLRDLKKSYRIAVEPDLQRAVAKADILIVAVRPASVQGILRSIGKVSRPMLAISLAAGVPLRVLHKAFGSPLRWSRAMPSPASRSGRGLTALTFPRTLAPSDRKRVRDLFSKLGKVVNMSGSKFDAFTVIYSSSHGYHGLDALARAAQEIGLDRETALLASAHALADGIVAWRDGKHSLESLLDEAATPGGIAATTMAGMDTAGYGRAVRKGIHAGLRRVRANARE